MTKQEKKEREKLIEQISEEICEHYCKYPEMYGDTDEEFENMLEEHCNHCPLDRLY